MKPGIFLVVATLLLGAGSAVVQAQTDVVVAPLATGEVIRYEPGRLLVIRSEGRELTYNLTPDLVLPAEVRLGRNVTVQTERSQDGNTNVTRVTTTSLTPEGQVQRTTEETRVGSSGVVRRKTTTVSGEVVSLDPGRNIVIRSSSGEDVTLALRPGLALPAETRIGQRVTLYTEPGADGNTTVTRVTTTSLTAEGNTKRTVEETRTSPTGETSKTTTITVQGKVQTYMPGKSITVLRSDGTATTYTIAEGARLPGEIPIGKMVTIRALPGGAVETIVVEKD
jgi:hypothetical protein